MFTDSEIKKVEKIKEILNTSSNILWGKTLEGSDYWSKVYDRLFRITEKGG